MDETSLPVNNRDSYSFIYGTPAFTTGEKRGFDCLEIDC